MIYPNAFLNFTFEVEILISYRTNKMNSENGKHYKLYSDYFRADAERLNEENLVSNPELNKRRSEFDYLRIHYHGGISHNPSQSIKAGNKKFELIKKDDVFIIHVKFKRANISHASEFKDLLTDVITNFSARKLVINLSKIISIDSTFIGALVHGIKLITKYNGDLVLVSTHDLMTNSFVLLNLNIIIKVFKSVSNAKKYFDRESKISKYNQ